MFWMVGEQRSKSNDNIDMKGIVSLESNERFLSTLSCELGMGYSKKTY